MGDWVGRQGDGWQATSTYWFSAQKKIQLGYRRQYNDPVLLGGGGLSDFSGSVDWAFRKQFLLSSVVQYERWNFPLLADSPTSNVSVQLQLTLWPAHIPEKEAVKVLYPLPAKAAKVVALNFHRTLCGEVRVPHCVRLD